MPKIKKVFLSVLWAVGVLIFSFFCWVGYLYLNYTVPILMYHYVDVEEVQRSKLGVSPQSFEKQMRFLAERKYNVITLGGLVDLIKGKKRIPSKTVVITFDDGYLNNYTEAFPILKKYHMPAAIFVVVNRIGRRLNNDDYMSWSQIKELSDSGLITIGSHSITHSNLTEVDSDEIIRRDIAGSKEIIEKELGKKVEFFSYPYGGVNPKVRQFVIDAGYKGAVGTNFPRGYPGDDIYGLKRIRISEHSKNSFVFWVQTAGIYTAIKEDRDTY